MPTTPDRLSRRRPNRNYLSAGIVGLAALPISIWLAVQSETRIVSHEGFGGPRTPPFGTICLDELFGPAATDGGEEVRDDDRGMTMGIDELGEYASDPLYLAFFANVRERVAPYLQSDAGYDIWLAERCKARVSGWPFSSWQQAEIVTLEEFRPELKSKKDAWRQILLPIASDGSHPRRPLLFAANAAYYWGAIVALAYLIRHLLHRLKRSPRAGFPVIEVGKEAGTADQTGP